MPECERAALHCQNSFDGAYSLLIQHKLPLFILVTSSPEAPIRDSFNSYDLRRMIFTIVLDESYMSDAKIHQFLRSKFE